MQRAAGQCHHHHGRLHRHDLRPNRMRERNRASGAVPGADGSAHNLVNTLCMKVGDLTRLPDLRDTVEIFLALNQEP